MVRTLVIVALVLIAIGVAGTLMTVVLAGPGTVEPQEWTQDGTPVRRIEINASNADVSLFPVSDGVIQVRLTGRRPAAERAQVVVTGDALRIQVDQQRSFGMFYRSLKLSVGLPEKNYAALQASVDNGNFAARELQIGDIQVRGGNGRIQTDALRADRLELVTGNGNVVVHNLEGQLVAKTRNGSVSVSARELVKPMELETFNGDIRLQTGIEPSNVTLDLKAGNGSIRMFNVRRGNVWHQVIGAGDHLIKMTTRNGDIVIAD